MHHNVEIWMRVFILKNILNSYIVLIIQNNFLIMITYQSLRKIRTPL